MFKALNLKAAVRRAVVVGAVLSAAVASQAAVISYTSQLLSGVGTGSQLDNTSLLKFNPILGTLTGVTVTYGTFEFSESSITNLTAKPRLASQTSFATDSLNVSTGVTINVGGSDTASTTSGGFFTLGGGATSDLVAFSNGAGGASYFAAGDLAEFTGPGTLVVTNNTTTGGSAVGQGTYFAFTNNFAEGQATVTYTYTSTVPSPAAAATMLIGVVGGIARRRRSA